jgi:hypothetical protein
MTPSLQKALAAMPARQLKLVAVGIVAIAAALAWTSAIRAPLAALRQRSLQLEASGSYAAILDWLAAIEARQPAVAVTRLALRAQEDGRRQVQLQLGVYSEEGKR